jgi:hypothetical protein
MISTMIEIIEVEYNHTAHNTQHIILKKSLIIQVGSSM